MNPEPSPLAWAESGRLPDALLRAGIRRLLRQRLASIDAADCEQAAETLNDFVKTMASAEIAPVPELANEQHYEVPAAFFERVLGPHLKYSSAWWPEGVHDLATAEQAALASSCERAGIADGMQVLDLGCGWGSLSLWIAAHYPRCQVTAVSNSTPQRRFIEAAARQRGLDNVQVITCDMNCFDAPGQYDRIVSVEMFEHMRNHALLFRRISEWLKRDGRFFMHIFTHRNTPYAFVDEGAGDWMSRHFFSGGMMPSADLPLHFQNHLSIERQWRWSGQHYQRTAEAWLRQLDQQRGAVQELFTQVYGARDAGLWLQRWRIFFMACAELFGFDQGQEWFVSHYRFRRATDGDR